MLSDVAAQKQTGSSAFRATMRNMRSMLMFLILILIVGCSQQATQPRTPLPDQTINALDTVAPATNVAVVGYLMQTAQGVQLVSGVSFASDPPVALEAATTLALPNLVADPAWFDAYGFGLVRVRGALERDGTGALRIDEAQVEPIVPRSVRLSELLASSATSEGQLLQVRGELLGGRGTDLLVEELGPGGVPTAAARQIKLVTAAEDPALLRRLVNTGSAYYGSVEVIGIWRGGVIHALTIMP
jgi:hypothetical protein